ncbi:hypothetical protein P167DRAFT_589292 [Morchella conica CCBAS932]|uniref:HAT C-terminal dimerisation domain-containing protein n=1 Tax=Morchella conica CCBAS932 TaxID=1392247 RepID=A0A3N4KN71_9PEZI|nr:hypothetical protein P167DRAFT_589292 [Morchella conica CCBAS932]
MTLKRANSHLRPLALANMILQRDNLRLDQTCLIFRYLYKYYSGLTQVEPIDIVKVSTSAIASLQKRWQKSDQWIMILSTILNPFEQPMPMPNDKVNLVPFNRRLQQLQPFHLASLVSKVYKELFQEYSPDIIPAFLSYFTYSVPFDTESFCTTVAVYRNQAQRNNIQPNLSSLWYLLLEIPELRHLSQLALQLFAVIPNSGSCERAFSQFGIIHNKLRNRLNSEKTTTLAKVKAHSKKQTSNNYPNSGSQAGQGLNLRKRLYETERSLSESFQVNSQQIPGADLDEESLLTPEDFESQAVRWLGDIARGDENPIGLEEENTL